MSNIEDLILKAKNGDKFAMEQIINKYRGFIYKCALSTYVKGYEVEDLVQIGYISVLKAINKYTPKEGRNFTPYVTTAIKMEYYYLIRQKARTNSEESTNKNIVPGIELGDTFVDDYDLEEDVAKKMFIQKLKIAMKNLTYEEKDIIGWYFYKGKSLKEYAKLNNLTYGVTVFKKNSALKKLRRLFKTL